MGYFIGGLILLGLIFLPIIVSVAAYLRAGKALQAREGAEKLEEQLSTLRLRLAGVEAALKRVTAPQAEPAVSATAAPSATQPAAPAEPKPPPLPPFTPAPAPARAAPPVPAFPPRFVAAPPAAEKPAASPPRRPPVKLEELLSTRLFVYIGAIALALAGVYLVKYSIDQGYLKPAVRVTLGLIFGAALLGAGEWLRPKSARISQACSAAGIGDLYAVLLAGINLYQLIPREAGFLLLALVTATAVALSLRQGAFVALLGLLGGFLTPALIGAEEPRPWSLFTYLLLVEVGLVWVTRRRGWLAISALTLLAGLGWAALWIFTGLFRQEFSLPIGLFLLSTVALFLWSSLPEFRRLKEKPDSALDEYSLGLGGVGMFCGLVLLGGLAHHSGYTPTEWFFFALLGAGCLLLGRLKKEFILLAWLAPALSLLLLLVWGEKSGAASGYYGWTTLGLGLLFSLGAYAALWRSANEALWALLAALSALGFFGVAWLELGMPQGPLSWSVISLLITLAALLALLPILPRREKFFYWHETVAVFAALATFGVALAVPLELDREWICVAWSLEAAALVYIFSRLPVRPLLGLAAGLALLTGVRLLLNPFILGYPLGDRLFVNWISWGYGLPAAAFMLAAWRLGRIPRQDGFTRSVRHGFEGLAAALIAALFTLLIRHYFHPGHLAAGKIYFAEVGALAIAWLGYALALLWLERKTLRPVLLWGGALSAAGGLLLSLFGTGLIVNPGLSRHPVGALPLLNNLLWVYGVPALLLLVLAREWRRRLLAPLAVLSGCATVVLGFILVHLEVRQFFTGSVMHVGSGRASEKLAYSAAWAAYGILLLLLAILKRGAVVRYASLAIMLLTAGKVFLFDTTGLGELYRVFSFLGLGVTLLVLAFLYQRFVFNKSSSGE